jgi:ribosomal protein L32
MCQACQEVEVGYSESSEEWDQTVEYKSEEVLQNSGIKEEVSGKVCKKCGEWKVLGEFSKDKGTKDGYRNSCKLCDRLYQESRKSEDFVFTRIKRIPPPGMKYCSKCGELKPHDAFFRISEV